MENIEQKAVELFKEGYSCSESIIRAAHECKHLNPAIDVEILNQIASPFSGGMGGSGCLCGAVAGAQIVLGTMYGRKDTDTDSRRIKSLSGNFVKSFRAKRKATCCRVLSSGYEFNSPERRENCVNIVKDVAEILKKAIIENSELVQKV